MPDGPQAARALDAALRAFGPDVAAAEEAGFTKYRRGEGAYAPVFAVVRVLKSRADVAFRRWSRARSKRVLDARSSGMPHLPYRVVLEAPGDLDAELLSWLRESYEISAET